MQCIWWRQLQSRTPPKPVRDTFGRVSGTLLESHAGLHGFLFVELCRGRPGHHPKRILDTNSALPEFCLLNNFGSCQDQQRNLSGPVLRDTARLSQRYPPIARYGVFGVSTWPIGCDTPSPFSERFLHVEHAKWRCDTPPSKGVSQRYWRDTPWKQALKANGYDTPPLRYYLERVLRDMGGYLGLGR